MESKVCSKCKQLKPYSDFYLNRINHKPRPSCKQCMEKYVHENKERVTEQKRKYLMLHPDRRKESRKKYYNKPEIKFKMTFIVHEKIIKKYGFNAECGLTLKEWESCLKTFDHSCACCGEKFTETNVPTVDCIIPLFHGGGFEKYNIQPLCLRCNDIKRTMPIRFIMVKNKKWWFKIPRFSKLLQKTLIGNGAEDASRKILELRGV